MERNVEERQKGKSRIIKRRMTYKQWKVVSENCNMDLVRVHISKKCKINLFMNCPPRFDYQTMVIVLNCLINLQLDQLIWNYPFKAVIRIMHYLQSYQLGETYIEELLVEHFDPETWIKTLQLLIRLFGFNSNSPMIRKFLDLTDERFGIPEDLIEKFLDGNYKLKRLELHSHLQSMHESWLKFWEYRSNTECIFCKENLKTLKPITRRLEVIIEMKCCLSLTCMSCNHLFLHVPLQYTSHSMSGSNTITQMNYIEKNCPQCGIMYTYNSKNHIFEIDNWCSDLGSAINRNNIRGSINKPLNEHSDEHLCRCPPNWVNYQPGTEFHGFLLKSGQKIYNTPYLVANRQFPCNATEKR